jgi:hypothetical protein
LAFVSSFIAISLSKDRIENVNETKSNYSFIYYTLGLLTVFFSGLVLRARYLYELNFWIDESTSVLVARQVLDGNNQTLLTGEIYGRAVLYHDYLAWVMDNFSFLGLNTSTRLANLPFYIVIFFGIFFLGKMLANKRVGLIATTLFTFSWISISIFRDARFYEIFVAAFVLLSISLVYIGQVLNKKHLLTEKITNFWKALGSDGFKFIFLLITSTLLFYFCLETQSFIVLILYSFFLFGILLSIFRPGNNGLPIAVVSATTIVLGALYKFADDFQVSYLYKAPQPEWKVIYGDKAFTEFFNYLVTNQHGYLPFFLLISTPLLVCVWNKKLFLVTSIAIGWYSTIALQGYGSEAVRYYYPALPFIMLVVAATFESYYQRVSDIKILKYVWAFMIIVILSLSLYSGIIESNTAEVRGSPNRTKNTAGDQTMEFLVSTGSFDSATMMTDTNYAMNYYLDRGETPDYVVIDSDIQPFARRKIERYTGAKQLDYRDIPQVPKPAFYVLSNVSSEYNNYIVSIGGVMVFNNKARVVYYFPVPSI